MAFPAVNKKSNYVKGGGVLRLAVRDATGPLGFYDPGNVPSIELSREVETSDHQEARSGTFQTDATFTVSEKNTITATVESMTLANFALFMGLDVEELELTGRGGWRATLDSEAVVELGGGTPQEVVQRTQRFVRTLTQVAAQYGRRVDALESADLRHAGGYALRLRGVTTVSADATGATAVRKR